MPDPYWHARRQPLSGGTIPIHCARSAIAAIRTGRDIAETMAERDSVGLCLTCRWARTVTNRRGPTFLRCGRADTDPGFPRYPPLPVLQCRGYEPRPSPEGTGRGQTGAVH